MIKFLNKLRTNEEGATAIEYGLIAALIAVALITALNTLGTDLGEMFDGVATEVDNATPTTTP
ncbi:MULTISPECIES: Flp family type IVb pilin [Kordiimonas]|jgi:pilus assembly protein Flp/PilA|uniref:Pilus assembly protein Flp/PilA n=1 Tax=Kordiimonas lacus TaxID=637679 RepID=A0A1G6Y644_9PROT|nr:MULTISPECIES: Flp family type IVb pilin [Kordiimonas]SDD85820.1 pilus assembly protein Flp/PilA [Kordiimonas lacus]